MNRILLNGINFLTKGWEVSILLLLPFIQKDFHLSIFQIGILGMVLASTQVVFTLLAGHLAEIFGNKRLIVATAFFYGLAWLFFLLPQSFIVLICIYALAGIGSGVLEPLGNSLIASQAQKESRSKEIGDYGAMGDMGRIGISACTTTLVVILGWHLLSLFYGIFALLFFCVYLFFHLTEKEPGIHEISVSTATIAHFVKNKMFFLAACTGIFDSFSSASLYIFIPFLLIFKGVPLTYIGFATTIFFVGYLSGRVVLGRLADQHGHALLLIYAEILMVILIFALIFAKQIWLIGTILLLLGVFTRGTSPIIKAMVADTIDGKENFDKGYSIYTFASRTSSVASRPLFGFIAGASGIVSIFYIASLFALFATIPAYFFRKKSK